MYKVASDRRQSALHRGKSSDWVNGQEVMTMEQQHTQLQDECRILEGRCKAATSREEKKALGQQKFEAQTKLQALKKQLWAPRIERQGVPAIFMEMAREMLSKVEYAMIYQAADRALKQRVAAAKAVTDTASSGHCEQA